MTIQKNIFYALVFLFCIAFKPLHHGWANYDQDKTLDYIGTIQKSTYENPHTTAKVKHENKVWTVILAPVSRMQARGVTPEMLKKGALYELLDIPTKKLRAKCGQKGYSLMVTSMNCVSKQEQNDFINIMLQWLEDTSLAIAIRQSAWLYPALEIVHISGIVVVVGSALMFDLRLLGFSKKLSVTGLGTHLLSWSKRGLLLVIPSGLLLFITNAETLGYDPVFWLKMGLLITAGLNALVFHRFTAKSLSAWNENNPLPRAAKGAAIVSIIVWLAIITCGRLLAY